MIFVKGYGQMCNNWLQYAHVYAWGRENDIRTVSMRFAYKYKYFHISSTSYHNFFVYLFAKLLIKCKLIKCLWIEGANAVTDKVICQLKHSDMISLDGFDFRFPALFMKYDKEIRQLFAFNSSIGRKKRWLSSLPEADLRLGLHVRRGDYAKWKGGKFFFSDETYAQVVKRFAALFPKKKIQVIITTNDPHININLLKEISGVEEIYLSFGNPGEDLFVLSECQYLVGPKSTFSLVASFYNNANLYWIEDKDFNFDQRHFRHFYDLFQMV